MEGTPPLMVFPFPIVAICPHPLQLREVLCSCLIQEKDEVLKAQTVRILDTGYEGSREQEGSWERFARFRVESTTGVFVHW